MRNIPEWGKEMLNEMRVYRITQEQLADKAGYTRKWVSRLLLGNVPCSDEARERMRSALETIIKERGE